MNKENKYLLSLDVSTTTIGIALFENFGDRLELKLLHHVTPKIKPKPLTKMEELFKKVAVFEDEFLSKYKDFGITNVVIEEPLLQSNNIYTIATLLRFNGMISKSVYNTLGVVPDFVSSYDARKYAFPELMKVRTKKKDGTNLTPKQIEKNEPVLFGEYPFDVDKKMVVFNKVQSLEPKINWFLDKKGSLKKENFDMTDAYACGLAWFNMRKK